MEDNNDRLTSLSCMANTIWYFHLGFSSGANATIIELRGGRRYCKCYDIIISKVLVNLGGLGECSPTKLF